MNPISRAINIVTRPNLEWQTVAAEPATPASILVGYVLPLAAIAPACLFVSHLLFGISIPFVGTYHESVTVIVIEAIMAYVMTVGIIVALGLAIGALAPSFGGRSSFVQGLKVIAYAFTPSFLAGALLILPAILGPLALLAGFLAGCYAIFLVYLGLPPVMGTTKERAPLYALATVGFGIVAGLVFGGISAGVNIGTMAMTGEYSRISAFTQTQTVANVGSLAATIGGMSGASEQDQQNIKDAVNAAASAVPANGADPSASTDPAVAAAAAGNMLKALVTGNKNVAVVPRDQLASVLPAQIGDMTRTNDDSSADTVAGLKTSSAKADYKGPGGTMTVEIADMGNASGLASMTSAAANFVESENDEGFEKNVVVNGTKVHETWKTASKHSEILGIVNSRFAITVDADGPAMAASEQGFSAIDQGKLSGMAASAK